MTDVWRVMGGLVCAALVVGCGKKEAAPAAKAAAADHDAVTPPAGDGGGTGDAAPGDDAPPPDGVGPAGDAPAGDGHAPDPNVAWGPDVMVLALDGAGKTQASGALADGKALDVGFGSLPGMNCFVAGDAKFFDGNHVFYALAAPVPPRSVVTVAATPTNGKDVRIYAYLLAVDRFDKPPGVKDAVNCNAAANESSGDFGQPVSLTVKNISEEPLNLFFAAAGGWPANKSEGAEYDLSVSVAPIESYCHDLHDGPPPTKFGPHVQMLSLEEEDEQNASLHLAGDLADGAPVCDLAFAWSGQTACFPEVKDDFFEGHHVYYALEDELPPHSLVSITVTPDPGVEVSVFGFSMGLDSYYTPPYLPSVVACEAGYNAVVGTAPNPGVAETVSFVAVNNPYRIFFSVAGHAQGGTSGGYQVDIKMIKAKQSQCTEDDFPDKAPTAWPSGVTQVKLTGGKASVQGDLAKGKPVCTLSWADDSPVACFPATQNVYFEGNHVLYALAEPVPPKSVLSITVVPDPGVEVSLYGWWMGTTSFYTPPYVPAVGACEASHHIDLAHGPNPGVPETISFMNAGGNPYNYFFAVAGYGPDGKTGAYTVLVELVEAPGSHCPDSLPGASYSGWPGTVTLVGLDDAGKATAKGDLSSGACTDLGFAQSSQVACFPATEFEHFKGNHVFYALAEPIPPSSKVSITVTPDPGVDVNLFGYQIGTTSHYVPPAVPTAVACEAGYPIAIGTPSNPGEPETIGFQNPTGNSYNIFFSVAGHGLGGTSGGYSVEVALDVSKPWCEESLPGSTYDAWPTSVKQVALAGGKATVQGDLSDGSCTSLGWAESSQVACFPATRFPYFMGNHVLYALKEPLPAKSVLNIAVTPKPGVDVSLYGYQIGTTSFYVPPKVPTATACEAGYPIAVGIVPNPGEPEWIGFQNPTGNKYNVFFAVAGPEGVTEGDYTIEIEQVTAEPFCPESLPGQPYTAWPKSVTLVDVKGGKGKATVDLSAGGCVNLDWASNSSVACWPAVKNGYFDGNHVFLALAEPIPPASKVTVAAKPKAGTLDVSLYGYQVGTQTFHVPPYVPSVTVCEAGYPVTVGVKPNPGVAETISFQNPTLGSYYNLFLGVAGSAGATSGAVDVEVTIDPLP